jgi:hypothetical protein
LGFLHIYNKYNKLNFCLFHTRIPAPVCETVKAEIMVELKKYQTPKGIGNVYHDLFVLAEK